MRTINKILIVLGATLLLSCKSSNYGVPYKVAYVDGSFVEMTSTYGEVASREIKSLVDTYKSELDEEMSEVIGCSSQTMYYGRPESLLTNLTSDVMKAYGDEHLEGGADMGVMNVHGHRAVMPKGEIKVGNLYEIYSFDNTITFLELKGVDVKKMFDAYARIGGAGISGNVKLVVKSRKVESVLIDGKAIDDNKIYKIVTLDYLADGNDNMQAFKNAVSADNTGVTLRDIMIDWVRQRTREGECVESRLDGRIVIKD